MTFNPFRVVRSLEEDFAALGLDLNSQLKEMRTLRPADQARGILPLEESKDEGQETLEEGLKKVKMKRMKASDRSAARRDYRKKKSKITRKLRKLRRKPAYKRKKARLSRLKGSKKAGARKKFVVTSQEIVGGLMESVNHVKPESSSLMEAFENVVKFTDYFLGLCEDEDNLTHVGEPLKPEKPNKLDVEKDLEHVGEPRKPEPMQGTDLAKAGVSDKSSQPHVGEDDVEEEYTEEFLQGEFLRIATEQNMPQNFSSMKEDASETLLRLKKNALTPADAMAVLKDMASYIQGAMKAMQTLSTQAVTHAGEALKDAGQKPVEALAHEGHVGQDAPDANKQAPVKPEGDLKHVGQAPNVVKQKPVAPEKGLKHLGEKPGSESQKPVKPEDLGGQHVGEDPYKSKPKGEVPVQSK